MNKIRNRVLFFTNIVFSIPIIILIGSYFIFISIIEPLRLFNGPLEFFGYPTLMAYYTFPYIGWGAVVPIVTYGLIIKVQRKMIPRIFSSLLLAAYMAILAYTIWWWATKQQFVWI